MPTSERAALEGRRMWFCLYVSIVPHPKWVIYVMKPPRISSQSISRGWYKGLMAMSFQELGPLLVLTCIHDRLIHSDLWWVYLPTEPL